MGNTTPTQQNTTNALERLRSGAGTAAMASSCLHRVFRGRGGRRRRQLPALPQLGERRLARAHAPRALPPVAATLIAHASLHRISGIKLKSAVGRARAVDGISRRSMLVFDQAQRAGVDLCSRRVQLLGRRMYHRCRRCRCWRSRFCCSCDLLGARRRSSVRSHWGSRSSWSSRAWRCERARERSGCVQPLTEKHARRHQLDISRHRARQDWWQRARPPQWSQGRSWCRVEFFSVAGTY